MSFLPPFLFLCFLNVLLFRLGAQSILVCGDAARCIASIWTDPLDIKPQQVYVAPSKTCVKQRGLHTVFWLDYFFLPEITPLTKHFIRQGVQMFISSSVVPGWLATSASHNDLRPSTCFYIYTFTYLIDIRTLLLLGSYNICILTQTCTLSDSGNALASCSTDLPSLLTL